VVDESSGEMGKGGSMSVGREISCPPTRETGPHLPQLMVVPCPDPSAAPRLSQGLALPSGRQKLQSAAGKLRVNSPPSPLPPWPCGGVMREAG